MALPASASRAFPPLAFLLSLALYAQAAPATPHTRSVARKAPQTATISLGTAATELPGELILEDTPETLPPEPVRLRAGPPIESAAVATTAPQILKSALSESKGERVEKAQRSQSTAAGAQPGSPPATASTVLKLTISASPVPAVWDEKTGRYITQLKFALRPTSPSAAPVSLAEPIEVSLNFAGMAAAPIPPFTITEVGLAHEKVIDLQFQPMTDAPKLCVRSSMSDADVLMEALPRLVLTNTKPDVLGFGLETFTVAVERQRPQGDPDAVSVDTPLTLTVSGAATVLADTVAIPAGRARTELKLRSGGLVPLQVSARLGGLTATAVVRQHFPYGPLTAALLGGLLGGFARRWMKGARRKTNTRHLAEGAVVSLVAFTAAVLGVGYLDLPAAIAATEAGAFLTGALCGFAGVVVLAKLSRTKAEAAE